MVTHMGPRGRGGVVVMTAVVAALLASCTRGELPREKAKATAAYAGCEILEPVVEDNLAVYPVTKCSAPAADYLTLDEAMQSGVLTVSESGGAAQGADQGQVAAAGVERPAHAGASAQQRIQVGNNVNQGRGATVNTLVIENRGDKAVFVMAGEIVKGGQQDRTIGQDSIIPPKSGPVDISVFCVEHGRWNGQARFGTAAVCADNSVRQKALLMKSQSEVWQAVAGKNSAASAQPATGTYLAGISQGDVQKRVEERLARIVKGLAGEADRTGFVVALNGKLIGADIFLSPGLCRKLEAKLLKSYVFDAVTTEAKNAAGPAPSAQKVAAFLADVAAGKASVERSSAYGENQARDNGAAAIFLLKSAERADSVHECLQVR